MSLFIIIYRAHAVAALVIKEQERNLQVLHVNIIVVTLTNALSIFVTKK